MMNGDDNTAADDGRDIDQVPRELVVGTDTNIITLLQTEIALKAESEQVDKLCSLFV